MGAWHSGRTTRTRTARSPAPWRWWGSAEPADRAGRLLRRPQVRRLPRPSRHPARGAHRPARRPHRRGSAAQGAYQQSPPRYDYVLTDAGLELWPAVHGLGYWGSRHATGDGPSRTFHHAACGTRLDAGGGARSAGCTWWPRRTWRCVPAPVRAAHAVTTRSPSHSPSPGACCGRSAPPPGPARLPVPMIRAIRRGLRRRGHRDHLGERGVRCGQDQRGARDAGPDTGEHPVRPRRSSGTACASLLPEKRLQEVADYQELAIWRRLVVETAAALLNEVGGVLIVPDGAAAPGVPGRDLRRSRLPRNRGPACAARPRRNDPARAYRRP